MCVGAPLGAKGMLEWDVAEGKLELGVINVALGVGFLFASSGTVQY